MKNKRIFEVFIRNFSPNQAHTPNAWYSKCRRIILTICFFSKESTKLRNHTQTLKPILQIVFRTFAF